ncbi:hypothetical protein PVNG_02201 [Plasmodium vivax North Korean]|uniref:Uncharacterized protein n=1 Tax=Plasmodium vivax North Korean TaxID=1035514 RepID=A0A0J9WDQ5_PLAVI|nr:hypothetical protein PVNG_02201 [Plasmodium vivax North Korean]
MILENFGKDIGEYNNFCLKLLNNLGHYSENTISFIRSHDRCIILYNWIYNSKRKHNIPDEIINKCFEEYIIASKVMQYSDACSYDIYNSLYEDPMNMTLLDIFDSNTLKIKDTLMDPDESISTPCRKYVCECVKIYDAMNQKYCLKEADYEKHENTCSRLKNFKNTYTWFFKDIQDLKDKIPSLDDIQNTYMRKCQKYVQEEPVQPLDAEEQRTRSLLTKPEHKAPPETKTLIQPEDENQGGLMSPTVSTAISTMAGASSFLALLYKVNA